MKTIVALCLFSVALAAPQRGPLQHVDPIRGTRNFRLEPYRILRSESSPVEGPNFKYNFKTENGIETEKVGTVGSHGQSNMQGYFRFPLPNGEIAEVRYVADENGYRPESDILPVGPPMPAHAIEQIRIAYTLLPHGTVWDEQGFPI